MRSGSIRGWVPLSVFMLWAAVSVPPATASDGGATAESVPAEVVPEGRTPDDDREADIVLFDDLMVVGEGASLVPGSGHVLAEEELERQSYDDVHRILRSVPGVNVQEEDGFGLRPNIGLRGTGVERSSKITLLEDGVLAAPAPYSAPAAYYSPTAGRMSGFEIRKGSSAIRQGPYTNGGVINYLSTAIPQDFSGRLEVAGGEDGEQRLHAWAGGMQNRFGWLLEGYHHASDGFKTLDGGGGTGFDLQDYLVKLRYSTDSAARVPQTFELKISTAFQDGDETYLGLTRDDFGRSPYRRYAASGADRIVTEHDGAQLSWHATLSPRTQLTATAYRNDFFRNWAKLQSVSGAGLAGVLEDPGRFPDEMAILTGAVDTVGAPLALRNNRRDYYAEGLQAVLGFRFGGATRHALDFGVRVHEDAEDRFQEEDAYDIRGGRPILTALGAPGSNANRISSAEAIAVFVEDTIERGKWTVTPGLRYESIDLERRDFGKSDPSRQGASLDVRRSNVSEILPGLGVSYAGSERLRWIFGVHRGFSPPGPGSAEEVDAESSINYEFGARFEGLAASGELIVFFNDYDNLLGTDTLASGGGGTGDQFNGGAVEVRGLEAGWRRALSTPVAGVTIPLRFTYTYTEAEFGSSFETDFADWAPAVSAGDAVPYIPTHQLHAGLSLLAHRWGLHVDGNWVDEMRTRAGQGSAGEGEHIDGRAVLDLRLEYELRNGLNVFGQLLNATDETYAVAERPAGLRPGRPRAFRLGVDFRF